MKITREKRPDRVIKYILHPGEEKSENDGQLHYIDAQQLANIYGISLSECIVVDYKRPETYKGIDWDKGLINLYPQYHYKDYQTIKIQIHNNL